MDFGEAIKELKSGQRVRRAAWAPGCWMILVPGSSFTIEEGRPLGYALPNLIGSQARYWSHVDMCVLQNGAPSLGPKVWSDADVLAEDWKLAQ